MDSNHFDTLTKRFVSRRTGVGLGFAGVLGLVAPAAEARKKHKKKKCKTPCGLCETCQKGKCTPIAGLKQCGAACVATSTCCTNGAPGCPEGLACTAGTCGGCVPNGQPSGGIASNCCTGVTTNYQGGPDDLCVCVPKKGGCREDRWCCGGTCDGKPVGTCGCAIVGRLCNDNIDCCSGKCRVGVCVAA